MGWRQTPHLHAKLALMRLLLFAALALSLAAGRAGAAETVDLELLLAVDASSSVNAAEFDLQNQGLAEALRNPLVHEAIKAAGPNGIAIAVVQWADARNQRLVIPWTKLPDAAAAERLADEISNTPRQVEGGGTAIGGLITYATRTLLGNGFSGTRLVVDISGDGRANQGETPSSAAERALTFGIVINGLAILNEDAALYSYYLRYVIGGNGAFVMTAQNYEAFGEAILQKLLREIPGAPIAAMPDDLPFLAQSR